MCALSLKLSIFVFRPQARWRLKAVEKDDKIIILTKDINQLNDDIHNKDVKIVQVQPHAQIVLVPLISYHLINAN